MYDELDYFGDDQLWSQILFNDVATQEMTERTDYYNEKKA